MIRFILILLLIFAVISIAPMLIDEPGYIAISMGDNIYELTVYTAAFWILASILLTWLIFHFLRSSVKLSFGGWNKIVFASRRRAIRDFNKGIAAYILEDYQQAEHLLAKSAEAANEEPTAYLFAASAADKQQLGVNTQHYLSLLDNYEKNNHAKSVGIDVVLIKIKFLMAHDNNQKARVLIDEYHKHIGHDSRLLHLEIELCLIEKRFDVAINYLISVQKIKEFTVQTIAKWEEVAFLGKFNDIICQQDISCLEQYWQKLPKKIIQHEAVLFAYCTILSQHNILEPIEKLLLPTLKKEPSALFLNQLRKLSFTNVNNGTDHLIIAVQKHLHHNNQSAKWLSCLGHLALKSTQWSMAEKAFNSLFKLEGKQYDNDDLQACATALSRQSKHQEANELLRQILAIK